MSGFTIVELLVVIVIVGILAAITSVSYIGLTKKATEAGIISGLDSAKNNYYYIRRIMVAYLIILMEIARPTLWVVSTIDIA